MSSVSKSYSLNSSGTNLFINGGVVTSYNLYDAAGGVDSKGFSFSQDGSAVTITGDDSSKFTLLDCNATAQRWNKNDRQYAYSDTYGASDVVRIDFKNADPSLAFSDMVIGFGDANKISGNGATFQYVDGLNGVDNFYFFLSQASVNKSVFTIIYDGNGNVSKYVDGVLQTTAAINFNTKYPNGLRIYTVFNNGEQGTNYHYKVKLYQPTVTFTARSLLCKNMGKKYTLNGATYIKVEAVSDKSNFYIKTDDGNFASFIF